MHSLLRLLCIVSTAHVAGGALHQSNVSFCLNDFQLTPSGNSTFSCPCTAPYDGSYCQVNRTLGPIIVTSALLSLFACLLQLYFRCKFRQFSQWPNYIVYCRSVTDFVFSLHLIALQWILLQEPDSIICSLSHPNVAAYELEGSNCQDGQRGPCTYFSFVFQFTLVGSLLWFGFGSFDYWKTISDPFVHPSTYKRTYTGWVLFISIASAIYGILAGAGANQPNDRLYREGMQACWTSTSSSFNATNMYTMYIWLILALVVTIVVGSVGYVKMRSGGTPKTLTKRLKAIEASRAQLLAFFAFWAIWGIFFGLYYFGRGIFGGDFSWTSYPMMGLLPLNGFVNAVVWLYINRKDIMQAYRTEAEAKLTQQRTRGLLDAQERDDARREEEKSDMSQALKDELLMKIASGMNEVLSQSEPSETKADANSSIPKLIFDGRPPRVRRQLWTSDEYTSRIPKCCRCPGVDQAREVEFIAHRPNAFQYLRESCYGVSDAKYLESFASLNAKLLSGGKSGALFFSTPDNKYLVKTLEPGTMFKTSELGVLLEVLDSYCMHMTPRKFRRQSIQKGQFLGCSSLITKIFGCYTIKIYGQTLEFYVMEKLDPESSSLKVTERYDLKGSWVARLSKKAGTGKDQNFMGQTINVAPDLAQDIFLQSVSDVHFFERNKIMDYSLLLAVHRCRDARVKDKHCTFGMSDAELEVKVHVPADEPRSTVTPHAAKVSGGEEEGHLEMDEFVRQPSSSVPVHKKFEGGMQSAFMEGPGIYFMGIIDPLQKWDCAKVCEGFFKRYLMCKGIGISAVPPPLFATRFLLMMLKSLAVSLASLASLDHEYRESYGIESVDIINHKHNGESDMYLLQLVRSQEESDLERVPSASMSQKSVEVVGRMMAKGVEGNRVACEVWEIESEVVKDPVGLRMVNEYRVKHRLGPIGTRLEPTTPTGLFHTLTTPVTNLAHAVEATVVAVSRLTSSVGRGSLAVSPVGEGEEERERVSSLTRTPSRAGLAATSPSQHRTYVAPTITVSPTSPTSVPAFFPPTSSTSSASSPSAASDHSSPKSPSSPQSFQVGSSQ